MLIATPIHQTIWMVFSEAVSNAKIESLPCVDRALPSETVIVIQAPMPVYPVPAADSDASYVGSQNARAQIFDFTPGGEIKIHRTFFVVVSRQLNAVRCGSSRARQIRRVKRVRGAIL